MDFTNREDRAITSAQMPRASVTHRLRAHLKRLLAHGDQTALETWSHRPGGTNISQQELSYFLNNKRRGLTLDDLDDLASFFNLTIGELLGDTKISELTGQEQRVVRAFRLLPPAQQDHFLALLEPAAMTYRALPPPMKGRIKTPLPQQQHGGVTHGSARLSTDPVAAQSTEDAVAELRRVREYLSRIVRELSITASGAVPDEPVSGVGVGKT